MLAPARPRPAAAVRTRRASPWARVVEGVLLVLAPLLAYYVLRIRLMPWPDLNDPAMHTTYLLDPHAIFERFNAIFTPTARMREGARVGFLVSGRIADLIAGPVPGFVLYRYVLALVAIVPSYLLLRRLYGIAAGALGVVILLSAPVLITAWGTDFPDAAAVSYLTGGLACLAMPARRPRRWLVAAVVLFTLATWSLATAAPLAVVAVLVYAAVHLRGRWRTLLGDLVRAAVAAVVMTGLLMLGSGLLLGQFDFITPTIKSLEYLAQPSQVVLWHSASWAWAPYIVYILVPPAVVVAWLVTLVRRGAPISAAERIVGITALVQTLLCFYLQFAGSVQVLEVHYFSSLLWGSVLLTLAFTMAAICRPLLAHAAWRWAVPGIPLVVALVYEVAPTVPAFGWWSGGLVLAAAVPVVVAATRAIPWRAAVTVRRVTAIAGATIVTAMLLVLTVAPAPAHVRPPNTAGGDPPAPYASALGGDASGAIALYSVTTQLPAFVGPPAYTGEQIVMWWPRDESNTLVEPIGIYHAWTNSVPPPFPLLVAGGVAMIQQHRPAQLLIMSLTGTNFAQAYAQLAQFRPQLVRSGVLRSGATALHVWLVQLAVYARSANV